MAQQEIHLHTAAAKLTAEGLRRAEAGEDLIVGVEIEAARAARLVERGGAIVVGGGSIDALDHDGDGKKGGARKAPRIGAPDDPELPAGDPEPPVGEG